MIEPIYFNYHKRLICIIFILLVSCIKDYDSEQSIIHYDGALAKRQHINSFILLGDTQKTSNWEFWRERNDSVRKKILQKITFENPAFIIHLGDIVFQGSDPTHWSEFDDYASEIRFHDIPIFSILGNHEFRGQNKIAMKNFFAHFPYLRGEKWIAFRFHFIGIILLNSNFSEQSEEDNKKQKDWYLKRLDEFQNDSTITIILVACHHPPYTNSKIVRDDKQVQKIFIEPFRNTPKAKIFFSGHCHSYEHFIKNDKHFIVSGGGGGPRHILETETAKRRHYDEYQKGPLRKFHFCRIYLLNKNLKLQMINLNQVSNQWTIGDEFEVLKFGFAIQQLLFEII